MCREQMYRGMVYRVYQVQYTEENAERTHCTVKRPILKSILMRQIAPLEYINTLLKRSIPKKPR
jgi:hypothetical protein